MSYHKYLPKFYLPLLWQTPGLTSCGKAGSCLPLVSSLQYRTWPTVCTGFLCPSSHHKITNKVTRHDVKHYINKYIELIVSVSVAGMFSAAKIQRSCPVDHACMCCLWSFMCSLLGVKCCPSSFSFNCLRLCMFQKEQPSSNFSCIRYQQKVAALETCVALNCWREARKTTLED